MKQRRKPAERDTDEDEELEQPQRILDVKPCLQHRAMEQQGGSDAEDADEASGGG